MICMWCDNPVDLLEEAYTNFCFRCHRYSREVPKNYVPPEPHISQQKVFNPLGYLELHTCVWEYTTNPVIPNTYFLKCINPVRAEKSSEYDPRGKKCRKYLSLTKEEYDDGEEKRKLSRKLHSYEWLRECEAYWAEVDKKKKEREAAQRARRPALKQLTQADYKDDPNYQVFLKLKEKAKSGEKPKL